MSGSRKFEGKWEEKKIKVKENKKDLKLINYFYIFLQIFLLI